MLPNEGNEKMKKFLQKLLNQILQKKEFGNITRAEVFFVFGSKHKTAMCDWIYGIKIFSDIPVAERSDTSRDIQMYLKRNTQRLLQTSICCTDTIFVKESDD